MSEEIIERTICKFADAAAFAKQCGFGMVTSAGHGWRTNLSPSLNTRMDKWGGKALKTAPESRLPSATPSGKGSSQFPIEIRISGSECYEGGYDIDEGVAFSKLLDGRNLIHVSGG